MIWFGTSPPYMHARSDLYALLCRSTRSRNCHSGELHTIQIFRNRLQHRTALLCESCATYRNSSRCSSTSSQIRSSSHQLCTPISVGPFSAVWTCLADIGQSCPQTGHVLPSPGQHRPTSTKFDPISTSFAPTYSAFQRTSHSSRERLASGLDLVNHKYLVLRHRNRCETGVSLCLDLDELWFCRHCAPRLASRWHPWGRKGQNNPMSLKFRKLRVSGNLRNSRTIGFSGPMRVEGRLDARCRQGIRLHKPRHPISQRFAS